MTKIEILDTRLNGNRLSLHVQFDNGHRFWYITTADRTEQEILNSLKNKYKQETKTISPSEKTRRSKLTKKLKNLKITKVD